MRYNHNILRMAECVVFQNTSICLVWTMDTFWCSSASLDSLSFRVLSSSLWIYYRFGSKCWKLHLFSNFSFRKGPSLHVLRWLQCLGVLHFNRKRVSSAHDVFISSFLAKSTSRKKPHPAVPSVPTWGRLLKC